MNPRYPSAAKPRATKSKPEALFAAEVEGLNELEDGKVGIQPAVVRGIAGIDGEVAVQAVQTERSDRRLDRHHHVQPRTIVLRLRRPLSSEQQEQQRTEPGQDRDRTPQEWHRSQFASSDPLAG